MSSFPPAEDDERTLLPGKAPPPGDAVDRSAGGEYAQDALPIGTRLGEFEITAAIGQGGFSMVYLVYDHSLQRKVALKEYMPSSFAARVGEVTVAARSERHAETFAAGLKSFINEARLLAQFDHPSLLKVHRFWEANGTGYMVMPFYEGLTLKQALSQHDSRPSEMWIKNLLRQLLDALEVLHRASPPCLHRDISPDNILLLKEDRPLLLDFGAARRVISDMAQALTVVLKPGYAPMEQYAEEPSIKQGPWTDIYALAAVVYFAVTGRPPMPSVTRLVSDTLVPLSKACAGRYSPEFLKAIDTALSVNPKGRPQSVAEFRQLLGFSKPVETPTVMFGQERPIQSSSGAASDTPRRRWLLPVIGGVVAVAIIVTAVWWGVAEREKIVSAARKPPMEAPPPSVPAQPAPATPPPPAVPAPDMAQKSGGDSTAPSASSPALPPITPAPAVAPAPQVQPPYDPLNALAEVYQARNPQHMVTAAVDKAQVNFKKKEPIGFTITSSQPGYVYILVVGVDSALSLLFPNPQDRNNRISADTPLALPRDTWSLNPVGPRGTDHFLVIVSDSERDFTAAGMRTTKSGKYGYGDFPREVIEPLYRSHTGTPPLFAGKAKCAAGTRPCSESYGAAQFSVEEVDR